MGKTISSVFTICSAQFEEFVISVDDYIYPCIVELKKIPNSASLVVGHNGFGEFGLWYVASEFLSSLVFHEYCLLLLNVIRITVYFLSLLDDHCHRNLYIL